MDLIRQNLLISSLKLSCSCKKNVNTILKKIVKDEQKVEKLESMLVKKDFLDVLLTMVETGEIFELCRGNDEQLIDDMFNLLNNEQKKTFYIELLTGKNKDKVVGLTSSAFANEPNIINILGELLYDVSFWEKLPKINEKPYLLTLYGTEQNLNTFINSLNIQRIVENQKLLAFYSPTLFVNEIPNIELSEEQAQILVANGDYWALKYTNLKNDENYISNLILSGKNKVKLLSILQNIPEEIKKSNKVRLALRLSENSNLINNSKVIKENLYNSFVTDKFQTGYTTNIQSLEEFTSDKDNIKLYDMLNCLCENKTSKIVVSPNYDDNYEFSSEERKVLNLHYLDSNEDIDNNINNINNITKEVYKNPITKQNKLKNIYDALVAINIHFDTKVSNFEIKQFIEQNPNIVDLIYSKEDGMNHIILSNLYYSLMNSTTDLLFELDSEYLKQTNLYFLTKDLVDKIGIDVIKNIIIYSESYYHLLILQKEDKVDIYNELIQISKNIPVDLHVLSNILLYSCLSYPDLIDEMKKNNELTEEKVIKLINLTQMRTVVEYDESKTMGENYKEMQKFCDENINNTQDFLTAQELFCQRYFSSSFREIKKLYESFKDAIVNIENKELKDLFETFEIICNSNNINELRNAYSSFSNNNFKNEYSSILNLTSQLKEQIVGTIKTTSIPSKQQINDFTGKDFQFLVHVIGAYGSVVKGDSLYDSWNSKSRFSNGGICTSMISDNYLGHACTKEDSVIFCFDNIASNEIQMMSPYDLYSYAYQLKPGSIRTCKYYNSEDLVNNTRAKHNEVVINRNLPGGQKRQPSYILCFDTINNESKKASEQFGIPIVFVDVNKHLEIKMQEMETLKQTFVSTQSIDIMKKIINMQETIRCGLLANNEDLAKKEFKPESVTSNILFLIENSKEIDILNELEILLNNEKDRVIDKSDQRNVEFNGDLNLIFEQLNIKKQQLSSSISLSEFKSAREKQKLQDQIIREKQLAELNQTITDIKEGYSLK